MMIQGRPTLTLSASQGSSSRPATPHNTLDTGPEDGWMLFTYIVEAGQPLASFAGAPR